MFPGAPEAHPSPTAAADRAPRGPWCPAVGARARTGTAEARRRGPGERVWRGRGGPGTLDPLGSAGQSALAICTARPLGVLALGCPGILGVQGRQSPAMCRLLASRAPSCHFVTVAVVALGGGARSLRHRPDGRPLARWLLGELAPGTPPPHLRIQPYRGSHPGSKDPEAVVAPKR